MTEKTAKDKTDWYAKGLQVLVDIGWQEEPTNVNARSAYLDQAFWNHTIENLWARIWARPGLSLRDRQLVVLAVQVGVGSETGIHGAGLERRQVG